MDFYMGQMIVNSSGDWRQYTSLPNTYPAKYEAIGVVTDGNETGALIRGRSRNRPYLLAIGDMTRPVDGRTVAAALGTAGRPKKGDGGKECRVVLYAQHIETAERLGDGNLSEGVRKALENNDKNILKNT
jgi:hypothetical protein